MKIVCVIITFNRKHILKRCLEAVDSQTFKPSVVYVIDNASTDGTLGAVMEWGYYNSNRNGIEYKYILNEKNEGGAGGFYLGMKTAFETDNPDAIWVMDDDGEPDTNCLNELQKYIDSYHFISPLVISKEDRTQTAFWDESVSDFFKESTDGIYIGRANPFNGILFSKHLIEKVGYPKKEMFIWGDEENYELRARRKGFIPIVVTKAVHIHPKDRQKKENTYGEHVIRVTDSKWKLFCLVRNKVYNLNVQNISFKQRMRRSLSYTLQYEFYYCIRKRELSNFFMIIEASIRGFMGNFKGVAKYM